MTEPATDMVNHPPHYGAHPSGVECITIAEHMGFNLGSALKYMWRADEKGAPIEDLQKARWYLDREISRRTEGPWQQYARRVMLAPGQDPSELDLSEQARPLPEGCPKCGYLVATRYRRRAGDIPAVQFVEHYGPRSREDGPCSGSGLLFTGDVPTPDTTG